MAVEEMPPQTEHGGAALVVLTWAEPSPAAPGPIQGMLSGAKAARSINLTLQSNRDLAVPRGDQQPGEPQGRKCCVPSGNDGGKIEAWPRAPSSSFIQHGILGLLLRPQEGLKCGEHRVALNHPCHADCVMVALGRPPRKRYLEVFPLMPLMREKSCSKNAEQENEGFQNNDVG